MSPTWITSVGPRSCFPRVSGDEPVTAGHKYVYRVFSPRERG